MITEPDDILIDFADLAGDGHEPELTTVDRNFEPVPSIAQMPKQPPGNCRLVVELPFEFSDQFLVDQGKLMRGRRFLDGVEYLRFVQKDWENGNVSLQDLQDLSLHHSSNGMRVSVAK